MIQYFIFIITIIIIRFLGAIPRRTAISIGRFLGKLIFYLDMKHRNIAIKNLEIAFREWSYKKRKKVALLSFENIGILFIEVSRFRKLSSKNIYDLVYYDGIDNFIKAKDKGKGVIFMTAHFGVWELSSYAYSLIGYPMKIIIRPLDNRYLDSYLNTIRTLGGNKIIEKNKAARGVMFALKNKETIGILIDQNVDRKDGVFVDFFGKKACTTTSLASYVIKTGAPVLPAFIYRNENHKYCLKTGEEIEIVDTGDIAADIKKNTEKFTRVIEDNIRKKPEQYFWVHRRWKTRLPGEDRIY